MRYQREDDDLSRLGRSNWWLTQEEIIHYDIDRPDLLRQFLSFRAWDRVVRGPLTETGWEQVLQNKWWFGLCYARHGLELPETYGLLHPAWGMFQSDLPFRTPEHLAEWLVECDLDGFILKPVVGWGSTGVLIVREVIDDGDGISFLMGNGESLSLMGLWSELRMGFRGVSGYLLQERLAPHPDLEAAGLDFPYSIRVVTAVDGNGQAKIMIAVLYLGRSGDMVNKWEAGALSINIDLESGTLERGRTLPRFGTEWYTSHPDSGASFAGFRLPHWDSIRQLCLRAARLTPGCHMVCWEVLLADSGPKLIEGNLGFGLTMLQVHTPGFLNQGDFRDCLQEVGADVPDGTREWIRRNSVSPFRKFLSKQKKRLTWI